MLANTGVADATLVDVVTEEHDEIDVFFGEVRMRGVEAVLPVLARPEPDAKPATARHRARGGRRPRPRRDAPTLTNDESVPIPTVRFEAGGVDVHAVAELRIRDRLAARHDVAEQVVASNHPAGRDRVVRQVGRNESRPQDDAVGRRVARRHAEDKGSAARLGVELVDPGAALLPVAVHAVTPAAASTARNSRRFIPLTGRTLLSRVAVVRSRTAERRSG